MDDYSSVVVKPEPRDDMSSIAGDDDEIDDYYSAPTSGATQQQPAQQRLSRTTIASEVGQQQAHWPRGTHQTAGGVNTVSVSMTQRHMDTTTRPSNEAVPHEAGVFSLSSYETLPPHAQLSRERQKSLNPGSRSTIINYISMQRVGADADTPQVMNAAGEVFRGTFVAEMFKAPPHQSLPASEIPSLHSRRLHPFEMTRDHWWTLCRTPQPGQVGCSRKSMCEATKILNRHGASINTTPWVAMFYEREIPMFDDDPDSINTILQDRVCIQCMLLIGARCVVSSAASNTAVPVSNNPRQAVPLIMLADKDREFPSEVMIGPDERVFNGLAGPILRAPRKGWVRVENVNKHYVQFEHPGIPPYPVPEKFYTEHQKLGF